jgi:hypothetical protein
MEKKKDFNEVVEHMMSLMKVLIHESTEEKLDEAPLNENQSLVDKEMLEEHIYEVSFQEDPDEVSHAEILDKTLVSIFSLEEDGVFKPCEEVITSNDVGKFIEKPLDTVENHIDEFICVLNHGCDIFCFGGYPIYDIEGIFQTKNEKIFPLENLSHT